MSYRYTLMIPGPVDVEEDVLRESAAQPVAHYGPRWAGVYWETIGLLKQVFKTENDVYILMGTGTAGLDGAVGGLLKKGEKVLVLNNGYFGERFIQLANAFDLETHQVEFDILTPVQSDVVEDFIKAEGPFDAILMVHHETHTGIINPVHEIGELGKRHGIPLIVDAISSVGGIDFNVDEWGVDFCVTAPQKALEALPGLALVSVSKRAWQIMEEKGPTGNGFYLDPRIWRRFQQEWADWHPTHTTMSANLVFGLRASLRRILEEGLDAHFERYRITSRVVKQGFRNLGFELLVDEKIASHLVTTAKPPGGIDSNRIRDYLRDQCGIMISLGPPKYRNETVRVGHMGRGMDSDHIQQLFSGLEESLREFGVDVSLGAGLAGLHDL